MALSLHPVSFPPELMTLIYLNVCPSITSVSYWDRESRGLQVALRGKRGWKIFSGD